MKSRIIVWCVVLLIMVSLAIAKPTYMVIDEKHTLTSHEVTLEVYNPNNANQLVKPIMELTDMNKDQVLGLDISILQPATKTIYHDVSNRECETVPDIDNVTVTNCNVWVTTESYDISIVEEIPLVTSVNNEFDIVGNKKKKKLSSVTSINIPKYETVVIKIRWETPIDSNTKGFGGFGRWSVNPAGYWNESYLVRYGLNLTELGNTNRVYEPVRFNITGLMCSFGDYRDLRIVQNDSGTENEIPRQIISNNTEVLFLANVTENFTGTWGYAYCNNSLASEPTYLTNMEVDGVNKDWNIKYDGGLNFIHLDDGLPTRTNMTTLDIFDIGNAVTERLYPTWQEPGNNRYFSSSNIGSVVCSVEDNGSLMFGYRCDNGARGFNAEWYAYNLNYRMFNINKTSTNINFLHNGLAQTIYARKKMLWRDDNETYSFFNVSNQGGQFCANNVSGFVCVWADNNKLCYGASWNDSIPLSSAQGTCGFIRSGTGNDDPFMGLWTQSDTFAEHIGDIDDFSYFYLGYFNSTKIGLEAQLRRFDNPLDLVVGEVELASEVLFNATQPPLNETSGNVTGITIDLTETNALIFLFILSLLWLGVTALGFAFKNFGFMSFSFFIGMGIGLLMSSHGIWLTLVFFMLNIFIFMTYAWKMR